MAGKGQEGVIYMVIRLLEMVITTTRKINLQNLNGKLGYEAIDRFVSNKVELTEATMTEARHAYKQVSEMQMELLDAWAVEMQVMADRDAETRKEHMIQRGK